MITAILKTVDNPEGFTINKKTLLAIFEEIQNVLSEEKLNLKDLEYKGEFGRGTNAVRFWKDKKTGKIYRDPHPKIKEIPGDTLQHVTGNQIPKNLKEQVLNETLVDRFLDYLGDVLKKGRIRQIQKDIARDNPELADKVKKYIDAQEDMKKWIALIVLGVTFVTADVVRAAVEQPDVEPEIAAAIVENYAESQLQALKTALLATVIIVLISLVLSGKLPMKRLSDLAVEETAEVVERE